MEVHTNRSILFDCSKHHVCGSTRQLDERFAQIFPFHNSNHVCYSLDSCQRTVPSVHIVSPNSTMLKRHHIHRTYQPAEKGKKFFILNLSILKLVFSKKMFQYEIELKQITFYTLLKCQLLSQNSVSDFTKKHLTHIRKVVLEFWLCCFPLRNNTGI